MNENPTQSEIDKKLRDFHVVEILELQDFKKYYIDTKVLNMLLKIISELEYYDIREYKGFRNKEADFEIGTALLDFQAKILNIQCDVLEDNFYKLNDYDEK